MGLLVACAQEINTLEPDAGATFDRGVASTDGGGSVNDDVGTGGGDSGPAGDGGSDAGNFDSGLAFTVEQLLVPENLTLIKSSFARSETDIYLGTTNGRLWHYDGSSFSDVWSNPGNLDLQALWGSPTRFFIGDRQGLWVSDGPTPSPNATRYLATGSGGEGIRAMHGRSDTEVYAVADSREGGANFYRFDGAQLERLTRLTVSELTGVRVMSTGEVLLSGGGHVYRYDNGAVTEETIDWPSDFDATDIAYYTFYGLDEIGGRAFITAKGQAVLERGADRIWRRIYEPNRDEPFYAITGHAGTERIEAVAVGGNAVGVGSVLYWDGTTWSSARAPGSFRLFSVYSPRPGLYFAFGSIQNTFGGAALRLRSL